MSKRKLSGKALAIQLGWYETHIVLVDKNAEIQYGISVPTPTGAVEDGMIRDEEAVRQMLKEALATPEFKRVRQAVFCLVTSQVITETATTPDLPAGKLEKLIEANMDMYFPVDVQDCHVVWQSIGPKVQDGVKELEVQLWAVPNSLLSQYYTIANDCGLSVAAIDYCGNSITSAVGASYSVAEPAKERKKLSLNTEISFGKKKDAVEPVLEQREEESRVVPATDLHITMEKELLGMTFVQNGRVVQQRFIQCGPNPIYQISEIAMMVEYFQGLDLGRGSKLRGILSGALAEETALIAELSDVLDIPLSTFPVTYDTSWFLCMGAALTTLDFGIPALNRPGKARREFQTQIWQYGLILAGALAIFGVMMLTMTSRLNWDTEIRGLESQQQVLTIRSAQSKGFADNYYAYQNAYQSYSGDWDTIFSSLQTYNDNLVLVMDEMEALMPENASVVGMQIGSTGLNVTFAAETKEEAAYLMMALRDMQYADLAGISSLQGGGAGPATSYGSGKEAAPSEGSSTTRKTWDQLTNEEKQKIYQPIIDDVTKWELAYYFGMGKGVADNMDALHAAIGMTPAEDAVLDLTQYTREEREAAFSAMITTNPFVLMAAETKLLAESGSGMEALENPIVQHVSNCCDGNLMDIRNHGNPNHSADRNLTDLREDVEELLDALLWNECEKGCDALAMTEELLLEDQELTDWYSYYLYYYKTTGVDTEEVPNCISTDKIIYAVVNDPEGSTVNSILYNSCLSAETRALIEEVTYVEPAPPENTTSPDETTQPDETTESTDSADVIRNRLLTQTLPGAVANYLKNEDSGLTAYEKGEIQQYLGEDANTYLYRQVTAYFNDGQTETPEMTAKIKAYLDAATPAERRRLEDKYKLMGPGDFPSLATDDQEAFMKGYFNLTVAQRNALENTYGKELDFVWEGIIAVAGGKTERLMLTTDPFAMEAVYQAIRADKTGANLLGTELHDRIEYYLSDFNTNTYEGMKGYMENLIPIIYGEDNYHAMIAADAALLKTENYYTGVAAERVEWEEFPYLDLDKLGADISSGGAKTSDAAVNAFLNEFFSYLEDSEGTESTTKPTTKPTTETTTDPTTESTTDPSTESTNSSTKPDENLSKIELVLQYYLPTYIMQGKVTLPGDYSKYEKTVNDLLEVYFADGSTGETVEGIDVDKTLNDTIAKGSVDSYLAASMIQYLENPDGLKCSAIEDMLDNYYSGGTGNTVLDTQLDKCKEALNDYLAAWLASFLSSNSTGNPYGDPIIKDYLADGKTNHIDVTSALDETVADKKVDKQLSSLIQMYTLNKKQLEQYPVLFGLMSNYYTKADRTGSAAMDERIKELDKALLDKFAESAMNANKGGGGGNANQEQQEPDTRYFFAVSLMYNDELRNAELERKGLDYDAKVEELEVE